MKGVIDVALLSVIRRWYHREGLSVREISRRTRLSRNTIRKYLTSDEVEPRYSRRSSSTNLDPYADVLSGWLKRELTKGRKARRTVRSLHRDLVRLGYRGSYDRVAAFARRWRAEQVELAKSKRGAFVPLVFSPGEAFQFDWSEDWAKIGGESRKLQVAQFKLSHSRAFFLRAYWTQTHEMLFDAHAHAFSVFGGVPRRGLYDNMKTAVDRIGHGKMRTVNARFEAMASHYLFEPVFCNPASGWEKGQIEKTVQDVRRLVWHEVPAFENLAALNTWLCERCVSHWEHQPHPEYRHRTVGDCYREERPDLTSVSRPFDGFIEHNKRVSPTCLVLFERNRYSVPCAWANQVVGLRAYADRLVIIGDDAVIAEHERVFSRGHHRPGRTVYDWRHYLSVLQRKPGALRNGAPFAELPSAFKRLQQVLLRRDGGDREMADILALVVHYAESDVIAAVEVALELGAPSKPAILNFLSRGNAPTPPLSVKPPEPLRLREEPKANVSRYDRLRGGRHGR